MSTEDQNQPEDTHSIRAKNVDKVRVEDEMKQSYIDYAMSVIEGRSLPDVRDGLKPVHRRILYAMHQKGITSSSGMRKCADTVGETMGSYHPHGDSSIYDALVRMAQDFSMRYPLIDEQGNFGSIDGDPPAAMRYTESRMSGLAEEMLRHIDDNTVDMEPNYDGRKEEPTVLPAAFPNLLANGSMGIAVGMSTKIPPHNLTEIINATIEYIENGDCTVEDLMQYVQGPDFPTGGNIVGRDGIEKAYKTGKGRIRVRANYFIEEGDANESESIIIDEIPYTAKKSAIIEKIADLANDGQLEGIRTIRDESDRDGMRIVIEIKKNAITEVVANQLVDSVLEETFGIINLALVDGQPQVLTLKEMIGHYVSHRREVTRRRLQKDLKDAKDEEHLLEARFIALRNVDDVVALIRGSDDRNDAIEGLQTNYEMTQDQAEHVVRMQLGSLTSMEMSDLEDDYESVQADIEEYEYILDNKSELDQLIIDELQTVEDKYGDERRTSIVTDVNEVTNEDLIPETPSYYFISDDDYIKRTPQESFRTQHRGGKGIIGTSLKQGDNVKQVLCASTHTTLYFFTNKGNVYTIRGHKIPESQRNARGTPVVNLVNFDDDEHIEHVTTATRDTIEDDNAVLLMGTENGLIKKTDASEYDNIYASGLRAINLEDGDNIVSAEFVNRDGTVLVSSDQGRSIRFGLDDVSEVGRNTKGVNAMKINGSSVVSMTFIPNEFEGSVLSVTKNGYGRRTETSNYRVQSRYGKGILDVDTGARNGALVQTVAVTDGDSIAFITDGGTILATEVDEISVVGRNTKGVKLMDVDDEETVVTVCQ